MKMKDRNGSFFTPPRYSHVWRLETVSEENKNGRWHGWQISKVKVIESADVYAEAKLFAETIKAGQVNVKHVREDDRASSDEDTPF